MLHFGKGFMIPDLRTVASKALRSRGAVDSSLVLASRQADMDAPRRHLGVLLLTHEVDLGRADIGVPGELAHLVHRGPVADRVVDGGLAAVVVSLPVASSARARKAWTFSAAGLSPSRKSLRSGRRGAGRVAAASGGGRAGGV